MLKRKSHFKSRRGCRSCKERHVKCDEQGPPCVNCSIRGIECVYLHAGGDTTNNPFPLPLPPQPPFPEEGSNNHGRDGLIAAADSSLSPGERRRFELELMHQWTTSTYESMCGVEEDTHYMKIVLPRLALEHDFVMDAIIAMAALEVATASSSGNISASLKYLSIALEYNARATAAFTANLSHITAENVSLLYVCSGAILSINVAIPQCMAAAGLEHRSTLTSVIEMFDLLNGMIQIGLTHWDDLMASDYGPSLRAAVSLGRASLDEYLDDDTREAVALLTAVNEKKSNTSDQVGESSDDEEPKQQVKPTREAYQYLISHIGDCFAEMSRRAIKGFCLVMPSYSGKDFALAVKDREPTALLILLYWAVLLDDLGKEAWWALSVGKNLAVEISEILCQSELVQMSEARQAIDWARRKIGLLPCS